MSHPELGDVRRSDVSDPAVPVPIGFLPNSDVGFGVSARGTMVAVSNGPAGVRLVSVADPSQPVGVGHLDTPGYALDVQLSSSGLLIADISSLRAADVDDPSQPIEVGLIPTAGWSRFGDVAGSHAYVSDTLGFNVLDISEPESPKRVGHLDWGWTPDGFTADVMVRSGVAYVARGTNLELFDLSDPTAPSSLSVVGIPVESCINHRVLVAGAIAYVVCEDSGLWTIDVADTGAPAILGHLAAASVIDVAVRGPSAYLAAANALLVIDVSNPAAPIAMDSVVYDGHVVLPNAVAVDGDLLFVAANGDSALFPHPGLHIFDISDSTEPTHIGYLFDRVFQTSVAIAGHYAYVGKNWAGVEAIDVSDPTAPFSEGVIATPGYVARVSTGGGVIMAANDAAGVTFHRHCGGGIFIDGFEAGDAAEWSLEVNAAEVAIKR